MRSRRRERSRAGTWKKSEMDWSEFLSYCPIFIFASAPQAKNEGSTIGQGRWPAKSCEFLLNLLQNAQSNAEVRRSSSGVTASLEVDIKLLRAHRAMQRAWGFLICVGATSSASTAVSAISSVVGSYNESFMLIQKILFFSHFSICPVPWPGHREAGCLAHPGQQGHEAAP